MPTEIDILRDISNLLLREKIQFMITGSLALNYYANPRMTRDIDIVILITEEEIEKLNISLRKTFFTDIEMMQDSLAHNRIFNIIHEKSGIKIDFIPRKESQYRIIEFERRQKIAIDDFTTYIVSIEDLIISKLYWAKDSLSDFQLRDVKNLLKQSVDIDYIKKWIIKLNLEKVFAKANE